jgi:hypothetical protein
MVFRNPVARVMSARRRKNKGRCFVRLAVRMAFSEPLLPAVVRDGAIGRVSEPNLFDRFERKNPAL